jgi:hypothetical protein
MRLTHQALGWSRQQSEMPKNKVKGTKNKSSITVNNLLDSPSLLEGNLHSLFVFLGLK